MNFDLADTLTKLLEENQLDAAIEIAESELQKIPQTGFHKIIGKRLTNQSEKLQEYIIKFDESTTKILNKKKSFLASLLNNKTIRPSAYYCEMKGFTINYDRWFIDLFSFDKIDESDWEWLCEFYDSTTSNLTITGFEEIQKVYEDVHENNRFAVPNIKESYEVCELIVILRLQELFRETYKNQTAQWSQIPMFVTAHDYEMIYKVN